MMDTKKLLLRSGLLALILITYVQAQFTEFHPELNWKTIENERVAVHFHDEAERTAQVVYKIANEIWDPICSLYNYELDKIHYVIKDVDDYSNGATYFFDNKIEIWASALDFDLRGAHNWLRNVISHEFTHMVQIQSSMKVSRKIPAFFVQWMNYEDKRRPDILYGFPNVITSYPLATINVPAWFAEGTAQYMRKEFNYDNWDSQRDMIIRSYALDNKLLTWNQMGVFGKTSLGNESVYNSGFAFVRYIAQKYGEEKVRDISIKLGKLSNFTIDAAIKDVIGIDGIDLYNEWKQFITEDYKNRVSSVKENLREGTKLNIEGFGNFYPKFSPDGKKILFISNKGEDYFGLSSVFIYNIENKEIKPIRSLVSSTVDFIDDDKILYAKLSEDNPNHANLHDLFIYSVKDEEETRLTYSLRANNPVYSSLTKKILFIVQRDGTSNLASVDENGKNFNLLTNFKDGEQVYFPKYSKDASKITFDFSMYNGRDIAVIDSNGANLTFLMNAPYDERNGYLDKNILYYSSDKSGIFNIYSYNTETKEERQITNVLGGAFMPDFNNNNLVYSGYTSDGYKLYLLENINQTLNFEKNQYVQLDNPPLNTDKPLGDIEREKLVALGKYDDTNIEKKESKNYKGAFTSITFMPFIRFDNYNLSNKTIDNIKPGLYLYSNDILNRIGFLAGASINKRLERDLFLQIDYRNKLPLLYSLGLKPELSVELYSISRKADVDLFFGTDTLDNGNIIYDYKVPTDVTYNLFEVDFILKHQLLNRYTNLEARFIYSRYTASIGNFIIPIENILSPAFDDTYLIGKTLRLKLSHENLASHIHSDINPVGRKINLEYNYEMNQFNNDGEYKIENGLLKPSYNKFNFHRLEFNWEENIQLFKNNNLSVKVRAASILGPTMPDFFDFYLGGLIGMKGYPFYSISGNELAHINFTYRFPLFTNIDSRLGFLYFDKVFFSVYADLGNAWNGKSVKFNDFKKGAGAELRFKMTSFYMFPTALFFNVSYAFDEYKKTVRNEVFNYGKEFRFYAGLLFDFSL